MTARPTLAYVLSISLVVTCYLAAWLTHFANIYGWVMDDLVFSYTKGMLTVHDWRGAFAFYDAYQPYYFLVLYLPLKLPISLPSLALPTLGDETGHFRLMLLYTVFGHALIVLAWGFFARLFAPASAAWLSVVLFATSPTLALWTPQPESRLWGLPFVLLGMAMLLRMSDPFCRVSRKRLAVLFGAGSVLGIAQTMHYTSLYLILPFCVAFWGIWLVSRWRSRTYWLGMVSFVLGCIWLQALLEVVSYVFVHIPLSNGPLASLVQLREIHSTVWTTLGNLELWRDWFASQVGWPLIAAIILGWSWYVWVAWHTDPTQRRARLAIALTLPLAFAYFTFSGTMAFFRQTAMLQPFMFLLASFGIVSLAVRIARTRWQAIALAAAALGVIGAAPWAQANAVFDAHQGLGRALEWAYANRGDRQIAWFRIAWFDDPTSITSPEELRHLSPDTWLITYYPWNMVEFHPSIQAYLDATPAVAEWATLYSTDTLHAELKGYGNNDSRFDPLFSKVRIVRVGDLLARMQGAPLKVSAVSADSVSGASEPVNVFDQDSSPDNTTAWVSANTPGDHWLQVDLAQPAPVGALNVVLPPTDKATNRIVSMDVEVQDQTGSFRPVWSGQDLANLPVITAAWEPVPTTSIRLVLHAEMQPWGPTDQAVVEELVFPGFQVTTPLPARAFAPLGLTSVQLTGRGLEVDGSNITPSTSLVIDSMTFPTLSVTNGSHLIARVPPDFTGRPLKGAASLVDKFRQSNAVPVEISK